MRRATSVKYYLPMTYPEQFGWPPVAYYCLQKPGYTRHTDIIVHTHTHTHKTLPLFIIITSFFISSSYIISSHSSSTAYRPVVGAVPSVLGLQGKLGSAPHSHHQSVISTSVSAVNPPPLFSIISLK